MGPWRAEHRETRPLTLLILLCPSHQYLLVNMAEEFFQSSELSVMNQLMVYLLLSMPCSVLVYMLLTQLKGKEANDLERKNEEDWGR